MPLATPKYRCVVCTEKSQEFVVHVVGGAKASVCIQCLRAAIYSGYAFGDGKPVRVEPLYAANVASKFDAEEA